MTDRACLKFLYLEKEDYDGKQKINGRELPVYSPRRLKELYPEEDRILLGETFEDKKQEPEDIGRIELNGKGLYISEMGRYGGLFRKHGAYIAVDGGGFIAILKLRLLPFVPMAALLLGIVLSGFLR